LWLAAVPLREFLSGKNVIPLERDSPTNRDSAEPTENQHMRGSGQNRRAKQRRRDDTGVRKTTTATETAREEPLAALHAAGGNQAVGSALGDERVDRATGETGSRGSTVTRDRCPRCLGRYPAGKPLDCEDCETALGDGAEPLGESTVETGVQPELVVVDPDDRYEREAERVAAATVRRSPAEGRDDPGGRIPKQRVDGPTLSFMPE
jgi:hypothetical protein